MTRRALAALLAAALLAGSCRTARPTGSPLVPLRAASAAEAEAELRARRASFGGFASLLRVRATTAGKTQSFRATLRVDDATTMSLTAFTPVGTTALVITAVGDQVRVDNRIEDRLWEGSADELGRSMGLFGTPLLPAEMAMLLTGLPPRDGLDLQLTASGVARATVGDVNVTFHPPAYPARNVLITRGADRIEIEHVEVVGTGNTEH